MAKPEKETPITLGEFNQVSGTNNMSVEQVTHLSPAATDELLGVNGDAYFGPNLPPIPIGPADTKGRQTDYDTGINLRYQPRQGERINFHTLRAVADGYDLLRLALETKKDILAGTEWVVRPIDTKQKPDARCQEIQEFLRYPDNEHDWATWFRASIEDLLVLDAWTVYPRYKKNGKPYSLELLDGADIKPVIALDGRKPLEGPQYQQVIKGMIVANFMPGELYYMPQNWRTHKFYGYSRVEQLIPTIDIALNRMLHKLSYYTHGSAPDSAIEAPVGWNMEQIKEFQSWWHDLLSGNLENRREGIMIPNGCKITNLKELALKDDYDDYLIRLVCYSLSIQPSSLIREQNRGKEEGQQEAQKAEGTKPLLDFFSNSFTRMICRDLFKYPDLEIVPQDETSPDPMEQATIYDLKIKNGSWTRNEARVDEGLQPLPGLDIPLMPANFTLVGPDGQELAPPEPPQPEGDNPPSEEQAPDSKPTKPEQPENPEAETTEPKPTAKFSKAAKPAIKPINRNRKIRKQTAMAIQTATEKFLDAQVPLLAKKLQAVTEKVAQMELGKVTLAELKQAVQDANIDWSELGDELVPHLLDLTEDGVNQALQQIGHVGDRDLSGLGDEVHKSAVEWANEHAAELVTELDKSTRDAMRGSLADSIQAGQSVQEITKQLQADNAFSKSRAEMIARTETARADIAGNMIGYAKSGMVSGTEWLLGPDACDDCQANADAGVIPLGDAYPSGDTCPPLHPRCVCDVSPVISEDSEVSE